MWYSLEFIVSFVNFHPAVTILAVLLLSAYCVLSLKYYYNLPPGPWSVPFIGNFLGLALKLFRTGDQPEYQFADMAKRYGDVFTLRIGSRIIIIANGYKSIKEAYKNRLISDRPESKVFEESSMAEGVGLASGDSWKYQRAFTLKTFRSFGVGRSRFESNIQLEAHTLMSIISQYKGTSFDPHVVIGNCVTNVISAVVLGTRYEHSDPDFQRLLQLLDTVVAKLGPAGVAAFFPNLRYVFPKQHINLVTILRQFTYLIQSVVKQHQNAFDTDSINDCIDIFLKEIGTATNEESNRSKFLNMRSLSATAAILFIAGIETSTTSLRWTLLHMIEHPDVQAKVQQEMDSVIGRDRMPQWADRLQLPYTEAVLLEVQRIRTVNPLGVPHVASQDTKLNGYDIPKGSMVVSNIWAVHNDSNVWAEPDQFKPQRFLDKHGKVRQREEFIPFSIGHRVCLGENLAKMEIFIFFTNILHAFAIKKSPRKQYSLKGTAGIAFGPQTFDIIAEKRSCIPESPTKQTSHLND